MGACKMHLILEARQPAIYKAETLLNAAALGHQL